MVEESHFAALTEAIRAGQTIDAEGLSLEAQHVNSFRNSILAAGLAERDQEGEAEEEARPRPVFESWRFKGTRFGPRVDFSDCEIRRCSFRRCQFAKGASFAAAHFNRASFKSARFDDDADFEHADLGQKAEFHGASFGDRARFSHARFLASQFFNASFGSEANFSHSRFDANAKFHSARFGSRANFTRVSFPASVEFGGAAFGSKLQMSSAVFAGNPSFLGASFGDRARLTNWAVAGTLDMQSTHFHGAMSMHGARIGGDAIFDWGHLEGLVDLGEVTIAGDGRFSGARFTGAERLGPIQAVGTLRFDDTLTSSPCVFSLEAAAIDFSDARFLAPVRLIVGRGDTVLKRLSTGPRLVATAVPPADAEGPPRLISIGDADIGPTLVSGFDVKSLRFAGADGIDNLHIESGASFENAPRGRRTHREVLAEEHCLRHRRDPESRWYPEICRGDDDPDVDPTVPGEIELARIYRSLRKAREDARDAPGAADFYYGEMEMRRLHARDRMTRDKGVGARLLHLGNLALLELYRGIGGYGVRPGRPLLFLVALILASAAYVDLGSLIHLTSPDPDRAHRLLVEQPDFEAALVFVLRSALLLPTLVGTVLSAPANWIQIVARLLGPLLLGLFIFGLRARVHR